MDTNVKKFTYFVLWVLTGLVFGTLLAGLIELRALYFDGGLTLEGVLYGILVTQCALLGLALAPIAWQKIYVEGVRGKQYVVKEKK
jgi:hypothetical protein